MSHAFVSPYAPKGLTDGSIPASYATFIQKNPQNKITYIAANGLTATPQTEKPLSLPDDTMQPERTAVPLSRGSPLL